MLIVAFDGMDIDLIEEYGCENLLSLTEFGTIENDDPVNKKVTSELFISFTSGRPTAELGVTGLRRKLYGNRWVELVDRFLDGTYIGKKTSCLRRAVLESISSLDCRSRTWRKQDLEELGVSTFFDEVPAAKPLFVPGYNPEFEWSCGVPMRGLDEGFSREKMAEKSLQYTEHRIEKFWELSFNFWDLVMLHIAEPDDSQHLYQDDVEEMYRYLDGLAGEILNEFGDDTVVLFMSDHGLPTETAHNKNAFYACNRGLFGDEVPRITDFYERVLDICNG